MYERTYSTRVLKQDTLPKEKRPFPWRKLLYGMGIVLFIGGAMLVLRLPVLQVQTVTVEGANVTDPESVSSFVQTVLGGNTLRIFPRANIILLSTESLEKNIHAQFPRFKEVSVERENLHTLSVTVSEYEGVYVWCSPDGDGTECFFMDERGTVFAHAPYFSGNAYVKVFVGEGATLPFKPISENDLEVLKLLHERLTQISLEPRVFTIVSPKDMRVTVSFEGEDATIYFDQSKPVLPALDALYTGMRNPQFSGHIHEEGKRLSYIDLRFSNKMVYKFE